MKYLLVDKLDNVITSVELASNVGSSGAKTYFVGIKKMEVNEFDKLWKVMSEHDYHIQKELTNRQNKQYEWWKEDKAITDEELKI